MAALEALARDLARDIKVVARHAKTEEDLRIGVEELLKPALKELGVDATPRYEKSYAPHGSILSGRSDAVYGRVVIEYEPVGALARLAGVNHAAEQLDRYLQAEAGHGTSEAMRRVIGVGLDGERIFFLRYKRGDVDATVRVKPVLTELPLFPDLGGATQYEPEGRFQVLGPYPITEDSVQTFLLYLRALRRRPLSPEALAEEFGPKGSVARDLVSSFYTALTKSNDPKVKTFFAEWDRLFGIVYGQDLARAERDASELAANYGLGVGARLKPLLFAVHTYYALLMKILAAELVSLQTGSFVSSIILDLPGVGSKEVRERFEDLESGGLFGRMGVRNFLEADFFSWYLTVWSDAIDKSLRLTARALGEFEPATGSLEPATTRDLLKKLYQYLVPKELRHSLGEYYTPDWLAELTLDESGYTGAMGQRLLDPACGSGTFLVLAIRRAREHAEEQLLEPKDTVKHILHDIVGFDLNPLAVIAARTNYLLALGTLVRYETPLEIPVYLCDSILTPSDEGLQTSFFSDYTIPSTVGTFHVPRSIVAEGTLPSVAAILESCVANDYETAEFLERVQHEVGKIEDATKSGLTALYEKIRKLEREGKNGIWARLLKNAFAPVFAGRFEFVVGNPPWVNWESLSDDYRQATAKLWQHYGLFSLKGHAARLGGGKKDLSMLMLYAAADNYLCDGGSLAFVITQTVFKTKGAGDGFRRFRLGNGAHLNVVRAQDLTEIQPFEGATTSTATVVMQVGKPTAYPVPYTVWRRQQSARINGDLPLSSVRAATATTIMGAQPIEEGKPTSPWTHLPLLSGHCGVRLGDQIIVLMPARVRGRTACIGCGYFPREATGSCLWRTFMTKASCVYRTYRRLLNRTWYTR